MKSLDFIDSKSVSNSQEEQMMGNRNNRTTCLHSPPVVL